MNKKMQIVGQSVARVDSMAKALGTAKYGSDFKRPDMLIGKALYAKYPHALIKKIDVAKAAVSSPGRVAVLSHTSFLTTPAMVALTISMKLSAVTFSVTPLYILLFRTYTFINKVVIKRL